MTREQYARLTWEDINRLTDEAQHALHVEHCPICAEDRAQVETRRHEKARAQRAR